MTVVIAKRNVGGTQLDSLATASITGFCTDPALSFPNFSGDPTNFLVASYPSPSTGVTASCRNFQRVCASSSCLVSFTPLSSGETLALPDGSTVPVNQVGGVAVQVQGSGGGFSTFVGVGVDVGNCSGSGYFTLGTAGEQIPMPVSVITYHEIVGHAAHHCAGDFNSADPEGQAIADENVARADLALPTRGSHTGGCNGAGGGTTRGCVVATAAYGNESAASVADLRALRDLLVATSPLAAEFYEEFARYYYSFSPALAERMRADERMAEVIRAVFVDPLLIALRMLLALPADPAAGDQAVEFATRASAEYSAWARALPLRRKASLTTVRPALAASDLRLLLLLSNPDVRAAAFEALERSGLLPAAFADGELEMLEQWGLDDATIALVCGVSGV